MTELFEIRLPHESGIDTTQIVEAEDLEEATQIAMLMIVYGPRWREHFTSRPPRIHEETPNV